jgi:hypothetical protein
MANSRPDPITSAQVPLLNTNAATATELQQVFSQLNQLIEEFNDLVTTEGNLKRQIQTIVKQLSTIYPFTAESGNLGYLTNADLLNWPISTFQIGQTISGTNYPQFTITPGTTASPGNGPVFDAAAGPLWVLAGQVYLDANSKGGIGETSGGEVVVGAGGQDVLQFFPATPLTTFTSYAGPIQSLGGGVFFDASSNCGISESGGNLVLQATGGLVQTTGNLQALGTMVTADGTVTASSVSTGGVVFKNGLYISGTINTGSGSGDVDEVGDDSFYVRTLSGGTVGPPATGIWLNIDTFFPGIGSGTGDEVPWTGSTSIATLGTIATGTWNGTAIALSYIATIATNTILGNSTGSTASPTALSASTVAGIIGSSITTVGTIATGTWQGTTVAIAYGGTGQTTAAAAFNALQPMTTAGDIIYGGTSGAGTRLAANSSATNKYLQSVSSGNPAWAQVAYADLSGSGSTSITTVGTVTTGTWGAAISTTASVSIGAATFTGAITCSQISSTGTIEIVGTGAGAYVYFSGSNYRVGINQSTPAHTLDITGDFNNTGNATLGGVVTVNSSGTKVGINQSSPGYALDVTGRANVTTAVITPELQSPAGTAAIDFDGSGNTTVNLILKTATIQPKTDGTAALVVKSAGGSAVLTFDTTNLICYPTHLVLPTS